MSEKKMVDDETDFSGLSGDDYYGDLEQALSDEANEMSQPPKRKSKEYEMIRAALESHLHEYAIKKQDQKRNLEQLTSIIEEYLGSFVLLGYNYDGESVTLVSATTQQQSDSLSTLIQKFIVSSSGGDAIS
jgi:hypothetical protein